MSKIITTVNDFFGWYCCHICCLPLVDLYFCFLFCFRWCNSHKLNCNFAQCPGVDSMQHLKPIRLRQIALPLGQTVSSTWSPFVSGKQPFHYYYHHYSLWLARSPATVRKAVSEDKCEVKWTQTQIHPVTCWGLYHKAREVQNCFFFLPSHWSWTSVIALFMGKLGCWIKTKARLTRTRKGVQNNSWY